MKNFVMIVNCSFKLKVKNVEVMLSLFIVEFIVKGYGLLLRVMVYYK